MRERKGDPVASLNQEPTDAALIRSARSGDGRAYGVLIDRHLPAVYGVVRRMLCNTADAEDVTQDAFLRAFERLDRYDMKHAFRNWLLKIATNLAVNEMRSRGRKRRLHERFAEVQRARQVATPTPVPDRQEWQGWLEQLDPPQRAAVVLFHFEQMSYADVAEVLAIPVNTVRTHLHRGRHRLRELMTRRPARENGSWNVAI